jgi:RHS repeat-associated protein
LFCISFFITFEALKIVFRFHRRFNAQNFATMDNPTLYTSAYLVAGVQGYTKHYYAGSERVSSAIGLGGLGNINNPLSIEKYENWEIKAGSLKDEMSRTINECLKNEYDIKNSLEFLHGMEEAAAGTMDCYFYHPDHLGSSSWITDGKGYAIQHLHYLPFGEDWVDQRNASWSAPYTFSAKEKDVETGYSYFGARYYDSGLSIWLSVDPMSDKYPNLTPYAYCANNPVILVDPDGRDWYESEDKKTIEYLHGVTGQREGYTHLGATLDEEHEKKIRNGDYSTVSISANFSEKEFVTQKENQCCAAAKKMCMNRGGKWSTYADELLVVAKGEKGRAGNGIQAALFKVLEKVGESLVKGIPVVAGMDHQDGSRNPIEKGGDGMTDHYVAIIGITINFTKDDNGVASISGVTMQYANPGRKRAADGVSPSNKFTFSSATNWRGVNGHRIMTNVRVKKP